MAIAHRSKKTATVIPNLKAEFAVAKRRSIEYAPSDAPAVVNLETFGLPRNGNDCGVERTKQRWVCRDARVAMPSRGVADYGTFKDSLRAPVHRWFKYPAGYSYRLVEEKIAQQGLSRGQWVFDPFVGSGTTSVEAKRHGVNSIGIEAHPFVFWIAQTKVNWSVEVAAIGSTYYAVVATARRLLHDGEVNIEELPELVRKCYSPSNIASLLALRDAIRMEAHDEGVRDFLQLALTDALRNASKAATGWPYIAPAKMHEKAVEKEAFGEFQAQVRRMIDDLQFMQFVYDEVDAETLLIQGDSRARHAEMQDESVDLALTSPPYLNNYDYADRTRLETYFWGWYKTWGEITEQVRTRLMMCATTQVQREKFGDGHGVGEEMRRVDASLYDELVSKVMLLSELRRHKGGKKSYDCMVAGYFNDMLQTIQEVYRVLKPGCDFVLVLGDSAPYGVHVPTEEYLARIGLGLGFRSWHVEELRTRGDKWKENPQRHKVKLREVILTLTK